MIQNPSKHRIYAFTTDNDKVKFHSLYTEQILEESAKGNILEGVLWSGATPGRTTILMRRAHILRKEKHLKLVSVTDILIPQ